MKPKILESEAEYRKYPALNFSKLAAFYQSQDHALIKMEGKSYFEFGKMFETLLQDIATGSETFGDRFFKCEVNGNMPDNLIGLIDSGADLAEEYVYTKKGDRSGTYKTRHAFLDVCIENPGQVPVSVKDWSLLERLTTNMMNMEYGDVKVRDLLSAAQWQVPIVWTDEIDGNEKKALLDCLVELDSEWLPIDIKTAASFSKFGYMFRDRYWVQSTHYVEGVNEVFGAATNMPFFVASKESPFLCQPWVTDIANPDDLESVLNTYWDLCRKYKAWENSGKPVKGFLPMATQRLYMKGV